MFEKLKKRQKMKKYLATELHSFQVVTMILYKSTGLILEELSSLSNADRYTYPNVAPIVEHLTLYVSALDMYMHNRFFSKSGVFIITSVMSFLTNATAQFDKGSRLLTDIMDQCSVRASVGEDYYEEMNNSRDAFINYHIGLRHLNQEIQACIHNAFMLISRDAYKIFFDVDMVLEYTRECEPEKYIVNFSREYQVAEKIHSAADK